MVSILPVLRAGLPLAAIVILASAASAQTIKDGGFEGAAVDTTRQTTYFTPGTPFDANWTVGGEVGIDHKTDFVFAGSNSLFLDAGTAGIDSISQNLTTDPAEFYTLSFYANDDAPGDILSVMFGGTTLTSTAVPANGFDGPDGNNKNLFTLYTFSGLTTSSRFTGLSFSTDGSMDAGSLELDDIKIAASPVPEASTALSLSLMLLFSLGGLVWSAKKNSTNISLTAC